MKIKVKLLGLLRLDRFQQKDFHVPNCCTVEFILDKLAISREEKKLVIIYINDKLGNSETVLQCGDDVVLFMPVGEG